MYNIIICNFFGHSIKDAGSCPFTGKSYYECQRCKKMIEKKSV